VLGTDPLACSLGGFTLWREYFSGEVYVARCTRIAHIHQYSLPSSDMWQSKQIGFGTTTTYNLIITLSNSESSIKATHYVLMSDSHRAQKRAPILIPLIVVRRGSNLT
jgi:hypothetical protein